MAEMSQKKQEADFIIQGVLHKQDFVQCKRRNIFDWPKPSDEFYSKDKPHFFCKNYLEVLVAKLSIWLAKF